LRASSEAALVFIAIVKAMAALALVWGA